MFYKLHILILNSLSDSGYYMTRSVHCTYKQGTVVHGVNLRPDHFLNSPLLFFFLRDAVSSGVNFIM